MTNEQLVMRIQAGQDRNGEIMLQLWNQCRRLVSKAVQRYAKIMEYDDLMQEGYIAFSRAVEKYDSERGALFSSLLVRTVLRDVGGYVYTHSGIISMPHHKARQAAQYRHYCTEFERDTGTEPTDADLMKALELTSDQLKSLRASMECGTVASLDYILTDKSKADMLPGNTDIESEVTSAIFEDQRKRVVWQAVDSLADTESGKNQRDAIKLFYLHGMTSNEISTATNTPAGTIRRRLTEGRRELRERYGRQLSCFLDDEYYYNQGIHGTGVSMFKNTRESATERTALRIIERENDIQNDKKDL